MIAGLSEVVVEVEYMIEQELWELIEVLQKRSSSSSSSSREECRNVELLLRCSVEQVWLSTCLGGVHLRVPDIT